MRYYHWMALLLASIAVLATACSDKTADTSIEIGIADFCPYSCPNNPDKPGFTVEIVREALRLHDIAVEFKPVKDWLTGVEQTTRGQWDGLLAPAHKEAPQLIFPEHPVALQGECFYVLQGDDWVPHRATSFVGRKTIVFAGWSHQQSFQRQLGEQAYDQAFINLAYDADYDQRSLAMLHEKTAAAYWEDPLKFAFYQSTQPALAKWRDNVVQAGCIAHIPLYLGLNPIDRQQSTMLAQAFDDGLETLNRTGQLQSILTKYGIQMTEDREQEPEAR